MTRIICVAMQKGGTGKTTTVHALGSAFAGWGKRVLMIDLDDEGSLGIGCGIDADHLDRDKTLYGVLFNQIAVPDVVINLKDNLDLLPSNSDMSVANLLLVNMRRREDRLKKALATVQDRYDFVLLDCPPELDLVTINAFSAANEVVVPVSCDFRSMRAVPHILDTIRDIREDINPDLKISGVILTRFDSRTVHAKEVAEKIRQEFKGRYKVFDPVVRESVRIKESPIIGQSILEYAPNNPGAEAYQAIAKEIFHG